MEVLCAALAGIGARIPCHPLDTIKTVAFTGFAGEPSTRGAAATTVTQPRSTFLYAARSIAEREGLKGFYRGIGVAALGSAPGVALYLSSYHYLCTWLSSLQGCRGSGDEDVRHSTSGVLQRMAVPFISGLGAEAVSCFVWVPIDVTKERLQSQPPSLVGRYTGSYDAFCTIFKHEGVRGLYKGYWSTLGSFGPFSAVYFLCYEYFSALLKEHFMVSRAMTHGDTFVVALFAGAAGNTVASLCTNPLELIKTRLQVQKAVLRSSSANARLFKYHYKGLRDGIAAIAKEEGVGALWKGVGSRIAYTAPNAALTMALFEYFKTLL